MVSIGSYNSYGKTTEQRPSVGVWGMARETAIGRKKEIRCSSLHETDKCAACFLGLQRKQVSIGQRLSPVPR